MEPHVHYSPVGTLFQMLIIFAFFGIAHLLALTFDSRASRAYLSLGF